MLELKRASGPQPPTYLGAVLVENSYEGFVIYALFRTGSMKKLRKVTTAKSSNGDDKVHSVFTEILLILRDIGIGFSSAIGFYLTTSQISKAVGDNLDWVKSQGFFGLYLVCMPSLVVGFMYATIMYVKRWMKNYFEILKMQKSEIQTMEKLSEELVNIVERSYKAKAFLEVVRFGSPLSRPLLLSGMYAERVKIGERIADAAAKKGMYEQQIVALIDDVGWTNALMGNLDKAEKTIAYGTKLAIDKALFYYATKGERHLSGICQWYRNDIKGALVHYTKALKLAEKIPDEKAKREMRAGILFGQADLYIIQGDYEKALKLAIESKEIYEEMSEQEERLVKSYSQLGRIHLGLNQTQKAEDTFHAGFNASQQLKRKDEMARNLLGIGEVYLRNAEYNNAIENFEDALEIFEELGMKQESKRTSSLKKQAEAEQMVQKNSV